MHEAGLEGKRSPISGIISIFCYFAVCIFCLFSNISHAPRTLLRAYWLVLLGNGYWHSLDDDHMTALVHRRWGSSYSWSRFMAGCPILISLASLTFCFSHISSVSSTLTLSFVICGVCAHTVRTAI